MGEYFELTFFAHKEDKSKKTIKNRLLSFLNINEGKNDVKSHFFEIFSNREILFDMFEEKDFVEYQICFSDFVITKSMYDNICNQLLEIVSGCFDISESILFATGIYELTYYYTLNVKFLCDFNKSIVEKFPFVFFQKGYQLFEFDNKLSVREYKNLSYIFQCGNSVQNIFANHTAGGSAAGTN